MRESHCQAELEENSLGHPDYLALCLQEGKHGNEQTSV